MSARTVGVSKSRKSVCREGEVGVFGVEREKERVEQNAN